MNDKQELLQKIKDEFNAWEKLIGSMTEAQLTAPVLADGWSVKDVIAHLLAWQTRSIERLESALQNREPVFPGWPEESGDDSYDPTDDINAWIYDTYHDQSWSSVYQRWRNGFLRFMELAEKVPEADLLDANRYPWMGGQPLLLVLEGSYEHHHIDHLESVSAWRRGDSA
jgi:hypothetical protein